MARDGAAAIEADFSSSSREMAFGSSGQRGGETRLRVKIGKSSLHRHLLAFAVAFAPVIDFNAYGPHYFSHSSVGREITSVRYKWNHGAKPQFCTHLQLSHLEARAGMIRELVCICCG